MTLSTMLLLSNCSLSPPLSSLRTIVTIPASPEVFSPSWCWTVKHPSIKLVSPDSIWRGRGIGSMYVNSPTVLHIYISPISAIWRMNEAICISMVIAMKREFGWSLWCRKRICCLMLWRIVAATFRGVLCIRITRLKRSMTLCIGYTLLQLLER